MTDKGEAPGSPTHRDPPRYLALIFGIVAATVEMAVILWLLFWR